MQEFSHLGMTKTDERTVLSLDIELYGRRKESQSRKLMRHIAWISTLLPKDFLHFSCCTAFHLRRLRPSIKLRGNSPIFVDIENVLELMTRLSLDIRHPHPFITKRNVLIGAILYIRYLRLVLSLS
ncbi:hypothetical protein SNEBB_001070 [Seison nebaliae]|nr:hypothetical protein SNEBB_001070 [Seison nebaliae]